MPSVASQPALLGPFVGHTTASTCRIWLHWQAGPDVAYLHTGVWNHAERKAEHWTRASEPLRFEAARLHCATVDVAGLEPDTIYCYRITHDEAGLEPIDLGELDQDELYFRTLPADDAIPGGRIDFLLMSCHNPDKGGGYQVWEALPQILRVSSQSDEAQGSWVRFALLGGDQIYADDWEPELLKAKTPEQRLELYIQVYRTYWSHLCYRKVLCKIPAYLMWDDHDITDGWGSRVDSYQDSNSDVFTEPWRDLFAAARTSFSQFQAARNPALAGTSGFDSCFRVGNAVFVLADLRSHRNKRKNQIWAPDQLEAIKAWIARQAGIETIFFLSPVVFFHDDPKVVGRAYAIWARVLEYFQDLNDTYLRSRALYSLRAALVGVPIVLLLACVFPLAFSLLAIAAVLYVSFRWGLKLIPIPFAWVESFMQNVGDLRDDIDDAWSSEANQSSAEELLSYLYDLQNPAGGGDGPQVVILSGDIHAAGYSTLHSRDPNHERNPVIPHVVASPVGYAPFSWVMEAIFRAGTKAVPLGHSNRFFAQISHHFTCRNVAVLSIRTDPESRAQHLKVKYYVEGFPEPQIVVFDLQKASHLEAIVWPPRPSKKKSGN